MAAVPFSTKVIFDIETGRLVYRDRHLSNSAELCRGAESAAQDQLKKTNAVGDTSQATADKLGAQVTPGYTSLMDTGYASPGEEGAATTAEMGAATQPFQTAQFQNNNRGAATNNASDVTAGNDTLALEEGQTAGTAAANLQQQKTANQEAGMAGISGEQQMNTGEAESMYNLGPQTINAWSTAQMNNPMLQFGQTLASAAGQGAAAFKGCWVAAELYGGWHTPEANKLRRYFADLYMRGNLFAKLYIKYGQAWAEFIKTDMLARAATRALFNYLLGRS